MNKRILSLTLAVAMIFSLCAVNVSATNTPTVTISSVEEEIEVGKTISVDVTIENNPGFVAVTIPVEWNNTALKLTEVNLYSEVIASGKWVGEQIADGLNKYSLAWDDSASVSDYTGNGKLCTMVFEVLEGAEVAQYDLQMDMTGVLAFVYNADMDDVKAAFNFVDGAITLKAKPVPVTGVTLNNTSLTLKAGQTDTLEATVTPPAATNKAVTWTSSNPAVATVEDGVVTAVGVGEATITVKTVDGNFTATCAVTVTKADCAASPAAVGTVNATSDSLTVAAPTSGQEYAVVEGSVAEAPASGWNTNGVFSGLKANTTYSVFTRIAETNTTLASAAVKTEATTLKLDQVITAVDQTVTFGNTLDLNTVVSSNAPAAVFTYTLDGSTPTGTDLDGNVITAGTTAGEFNVKINSGAVGAYNAAAEKIIKVSIVDKVKKDLTVTMAGWTYGSAANEPVYTAPANTIVADKIVYSATPSDAGDYTVTVTCETATEIYTGTANFTIDKLDISAAEVTLGEALTYNKTEQTQTVTSVKVGTHDVATYDVTENTATNGGQYTLKVTGTGNYTGVANVPFTVAKANATITVDYASVSVKMQKDFTVTATIDNGGALTYSSQNVSIATVDNTGKITGVKPGDTTVTVSYAGDGNYNPTYKDIAVKVTELEPQEVSFVTADQIKTYGDVAFDVEAKNDTDGGGAITFSSSNTNVITVEGNTVTIVGAGTAKVIATAAPVTGFAATTAELNVTVNKAASPALTVTGADEVAYAETIELGVEGGSAEDSAVTYTVVSGDATIEGNKLTANGVGEIKVKATKAETANYLAVESAEKTITAKKNETYQTEDKTSENKTGEAVEIADVIPADIWEEVKTKLNEVAVVVKMVQNAVEEVLTEDAMKKIFLNGEVKIEEGKLVFELLPAATVGDYIIEVSVPETSLAGNFVATVELNVTKANSGYDRPMRPAAVPAEVKDVIGLINDLPSAKKVTLDDEELIEDARKAYEKLSKANQAKVSNYADLVAAEEALEALKEAAAEVVENPFVDVDEDAYYADAVLWAIENNITAGTSIDTFSPEAVCTRAQVVTFLWRAAGCPAPLTSDMPFADVEAGAYYAAAVQWAVENNITAGTAFDAFDPNGECTRGQIVTFLWRAQGNPAAAAVGGFEDVEDGAYYDAPVVWAVANGITNGTSATTFSPAADCTRAQVVTFLYRCLAE